MRHGPLELITFDGDVTLYDDGDVLTPENPVLPRILVLLESGVKVGIVTAAGYTQAERYYERLYGLLDAVSASTSLTAENRENLIIMGGEANYLFRFSATHKYCLDMLSRKEWMLDEMRTWTQKDIDELLKLAERALKDCVKNLDLDAQVIRKERAIGIIPKSGKHFAREQLEETVMVTQRTLVRLNIPHHLLFAQFLQETSPVGRKIPFCAFNGESPDCRIIDHARKLINDVFVDIGDKSWGVLACQRYFGGIDGSKSLHVGDQFLSAGANDFKARLACTTAWIANPQETVRLLDELHDLSNSEALSLQLHGDSTPLKRKQGEQHKSTDLDEYDQTSETDAATATSRKRRKLTDDVSENGLNLRSDSVIGLHHESASDCDSEAIDDEDDDDDATGKKAAAQPARKCGRPKENVKTEEEFTPHIKDVVLSQTKRKPGRPPKQLASETVVQQAIYVAEPAKRGPGRPRKSSYNANGQAPPSKATSNTSTPVSRGTGRPRKNPGPANAHTPGSNSKIKAGTPAPRGRGRPRKEPKAESDEGVLADEEGEEAENAEEEVAAAGNGKAVKDKGLSQWYENGKLKKGFQSRMSGSPARST